MLPAETNFDPTKFLVTERAVVNGSLLKSLTRVHGRLDLFNRVNKRFRLTDDNSTSNTAAFQLNPKKLGIKYFPAYYQVLTKFLRPLDSHAPRQVQFSLRLSF